jgi:hypothetical protein
MSQPAHYKGSWRAMKDNTKWRMKPSKLCYKCKNDCTHYCVGELTYCHRFLGKESNEKEGV